MQQIRIDFDNPGLPQSLGAVEGESQSRIFQAALYKSGAAYTAPAGAVYSIMYRGFGPQNQGWYDTIEDGAGKRAACTVSGNVVTCELARQALRVPGHLTVVLCVSDAKGYMLKSWPIMADVRNDGYEDTVEVESFFYITQITSAEWDKAFAAWEDFKATIDPTLTLSGKAADAKATGAAVDKLEDKKADKTALDTERKRIDTLNEGGLNLKDEVIDTSIKAWLTEHPEATTTVQDGAITEPKLSNELRKKMNDNTNGMTNVLSLGVDNTGRNDCSAILNSYTGSKPLYFPIGRYRMDNTFKPTTSIIGESYSRNNGSGTTTFIQGENAQKVVHIYEHSAKLGNIAVRNIDIEMTYDSINSVGLYIQCNKQNNSYTISHVSIRNLMGGYGIYAAGAEDFSSRCLYMDNIFILGKSCQYDNTGIYISDKVGDGQHNTIEIMAVRVGMQIANIHNFTNVHIWCGKLGTIELEEEKAVKTRCIIVKSRSNINFVNLYTDTALIVFFIEDNAYVTVQNFTHWDDGTLSDLIKSAKETGGLAYFNKCGGLTIDNCCIKIPDYFSYMSGNKNGGLHNFIRIDGLRRMYWYKSEYLAENNISQSRLYEILTSGKAIASYYMPIDDANYAPIALLNVTKKGVYKLRVSTVTDEVDDVTINVNNDYKIGQNFDVTLTSTRSGTGSSGANKLFYRMENSLIFLYTKNNKQSSNWNQIITTHIKDYTNSISLFGTSDEIFIKSTPLIDAMIQADTTGLTKVTYTS